VPLDARPAAPPLESLALTATGTGTGTVPSGPFVRQRGTVCDVVDAIRPGLLLGYTTACADRPDGPAVPPFHAALRAEVAGWVVE